VANLKISVFGLGYVGCISLGCLAKNGHQVIGVDTNIAKVNLISEGKAPIVEPEIDSIIRQQHESGRIFATTDSFKAVLETDISFVSVGTPGTANGHPDLSAIFKVAEEIGNAIKKKNSFHIVAMRSTVS
jgi:GDP-mannose 6-dehydrogenase